MFKLLIICLILFISPQLTAADSTVKTQTLHFCKGNSDYPPYNYFQNNPNHAQQNMGYDIDLLKMTFEGTPYNFQVHALPWKRCLLEVKKGNIDALMSASSNEQRRQDFDFSEPYYYLTPAIFYLKSDYPNGLPTRDINELKGHGSICGIQSFNYKNFGVDDDRFIFRIHHIPQLPYLLIKERCRFFLARQEILFSTLALNKITYLSDLIQGEMLTSVEQEPFYMLISKSSPNRKHIKQLFDAKVTELSAQGELHSMIDKHIQTLIHTSNF
ncbi:transporter substrate-binding domain-containing protein [Shewanella sp. Isolate11]|uniref:substrate-binding periplasmic protein n=1 Tax=Shewanella sp. Isolate11 TaxID=2908530 RepID=UPI001EFCF62D|nr:transporter substrate-binding domain-containing protein [Shewanella sp. Isolate11]MCG9695404.1 transporter substrate-binding domain-containing protein [Shewanella sp. Isolate11]